MGVSGDTLEYKIDMTSKNYGVSSYDLIGIALRTSPNNMRMHSSTTLLAIIRSVFRTPDHDPGIPDTKMLHDPHV